MTTSQKRRNMTSSQKRRNRRLNRLRNRRSSRFDYVGFFYCVALSAICFCLSAIIVIGALVN